MGRTSHTFSSGCGIRSTFAVVLVAVRSPPPPPPPAIRIVSSRVRSPGVAPLEAHAASETRDRITSPRIGVSDKVVYKLSRGQPAGNHHLLDGEEVEGVHGERAVAGAPVQMR